MRTGSYLGVVGVSYGTGLRMLALREPVHARAIPGTRKAAHMLDNVQAGMGALPDAAMRETIAAAVG
jgi:hypothetical protein